MTSTVKIACKCGKVRGEVTGASPGTVNRVICYCADCQAFAHHLGRADILDAHGGSDVVQVAPATIRFETGREHIACVRLSPKGLYRFHAACCGTPLGNTVGPAIPFIGIVAGAFAVDGQSPDALLGKPTGAILARDAVGKVPGADEGIGYRQYARAIRRVLGWRLTGKAWPNPFFDRATKQPVYPITVLPKERQAALRALCGPRPSR